MAKCNIDAIAGAEIMSRFSQDITSYEEYQIKEKFTGLCFYETWGRKDYRECFCTLCENSLVVEKDYDREFFNQHHNDWVRCPVCLGEVQLKSLGRIKNFRNLDETISAAFVRVDKEGNLLISAGLATRSIGGWNDLYPYVDFREKCRYYLSPGKVIGWRRTLNYYWDMIVGESPWIQTKNICKPFQNNTFRGYNDSYWLIGSEKLEESNFKYCQLNEWYHAETGYWLYELNNKVTLCIEYLAEYALHPQIEMAVKLGFSDAVTDLCKGKKNHKDLNWKADKPWDFLRLSKADTKAFLSCPSFDLLHWIHEEQRACSGMKVQDMIQLWGSMGGVEAKKLASCALRFGISAHQADHYISSWQGGTKSQGAELWYDYLDMAKKLGYDLSRKDVLMPKNLRERHDAAAQTIQIEKDEKAAKAYAKRLKMLREKYEFEFDGLRIVVPENGRQIVEEGKVLQHCVGGYAARHVNGKTTILFLRRSRRPERSYITIEMTGMNGNKIAQIHGYKNEHYSKAVSPKKRYEHFLSVWQEWLRAGSKRDRNGQPILTEAGNEGAA